MKASDCLYYTLASFSPLGKLGLPRVSCPQRFGGRWGLALGRASPWTTEVQQGAAGAGVTCGIAGEPNPQQQIGRKKRDGGGEECHVAWVRKNVYTDSQIGLLFFYFLYMILIWSFLLKFSTRIQTGYLTFISICRVDSLWPSHNWVAFS